MSNTNDPAVWMWAQACEMLDQAERLHRQFFRPAASGQEFATWEPPIDVFEDEREIIIVVAMPGVAADRVEVTYEPGLLTVRGARHVPMRQPSHLVRRLEIPYGAFMRRIALPPGPLEPEPTELVQGCLIVTLKKPAP